MVPYSIYLHIPFCRHRCGYCDFNTYAGLEGMIGEYGQALRGEIALAGKAAQAAGLGLLPVQTIFFGGGTPSLLPAAELEGILGALRQAFSVQPGAEITLEANPGTLSLAYLKDLRALGVNRLSLGVQSANPEELRLLERQHDYADVIRAVTWARQAGFHNLNLDLIFGLPFQALASWQHTVELALGLNPEHFSLYALTIEHGTPLAHWAQRGLLPEPDPDVAAEMYEWAAERLAQAGYMQYEISNWARQAAQEGSGQTGANLEGISLPTGERILASQHNIQYWRNLPYLGLGAGAHGFAAGVRTINTLAPAAYIQRCLEGSPQPFPRTPATASYQTVDRQAEIGEMMMMGLRLVQEGVSDGDFRERFGEGLDQVFGPQIQRLSRQGLLEWSGDRLRLTPHGRLLGNRVFVEFV